MSRSQRIWSRKSRKSEWCSAYTSLISSSVAMPLSTRRVMAVKWSSVGSSSVLFPPASMFRVECGTNVGGFRRSGLFVLYTQIRKRWLYSAQNRTDIAVLAGADMPKHINFQHCLDCMTHTTANVGICVLIFCMPRGLQLYMLLAHAHAKYCQALCCLSWKHWLSCGVCVAWMSSVNISRILV